MAKDPSSSVAAAEALALDPNLDDLPGRVTALQAVVADQAEQLRAQAAEIAMLADAGVATGDKQLIGRIRYVLDRYFAGPNDQPPADAL